MTVYSSTNASTHDSSSASTQRLSTNTNMCFDCVLEYHSSSGTTCFVSTVLTILTKAGGPESRLRPRDHRLTTTVETTSDKLTRTMLITEN